MPAKAATDVRWVDDDNILIADLERGVGQVTLQTSNKATVSWLSEWPPPTGPGTAAKHIALSGDRIAASDLAFILRWHERQGSASGQMVVEYIIDLDLKGDRLLVSGLRRDRAGKVGLDGALAWLGSLSAGEEGLKPVLPFRDRNVIQNCAGFGLGVVRFMSDGSFVVVPGAEPGIFLFTRDGHLQHSWHTDAFGVEAPCAMSLEQRTLLGTKPLDREEWVNRHAMIDEVIDTPDGPAVIIRALKNGRTTWEMVVLNSDGGVRFTLPFSSADRWAHVSSDTRGGRSIFLIADRLALLEGGVTSRLILTEWSEH